MLKIIIAPPKNWSALFIMPELGGVEPVAAAAPPFVGVTEVEAFMLNPGDVVDGSTVALVEAPTGGAVEVPTAMPLIDKSRGTPYPKQRSSANWAVTIENVNHL